MCYNGELSLMPNICFNSFRFPDYLELYQILEEKQHLSESSMSI